MELAILSVSFLIFLVLGVPVSFALGISCVLTYMVEGLPIATAMQSMISGMNAFSFLAVPFFIFSGELMLHGGIADRILRFAQATVGHFRGGLGMANVVACTLFGGVSGSPTADTSAMGGVVIPLMKREGYSAAYAVNVTTHASLAGALMPTSTNMIIYAFAAQGITGMLHGQQVSGVSIGDLLFSGLLPVLWVMGFVLVAAYWQAVRHGYPRREDGSSALPSFPGWYAVLRSFVGAVPGLMVIAIILVCREGDCDRDGSGRDRRRVFARADRDRVPHADRREAAPCAVACGAHDGRRAAADRRVEHAALPDVVPGDSGCDRRAAEAVDRRAVADAAVHQHHPGVPRHVRRHGRAHPDHDAAVPADRDGVRRRAGAVRDHAAAELLARPRAPADRLGAVRRLRDRQRVDRRDDEDGVAVLPRDLQCDQHRHVYAVLLDLAAEPDQRPRGVLTARPCLSRRRTTSGAVITSTVFFTYRVSRIAYPSP